MPVAKPLKVSTGAMAEFSALDTVASANLGTGTANSSTFLCGDGTWSTPSGGSSGDSDQLVLGAQVFS